MIDCTDLDDAALRAWPLPWPAPGADKESRGRVLVIAGSGEMPGAAVLAATAALRAGAGKLVVGTPQCIAPWVAAALPEARVISMRETADGVEVSADAAEHFVDLIPRTAAVVIGPGMQPEPGVCALVEALLPHLRDTPLVLDAAAMGVVRAGRHTQVQFNQPTVLTPHAGEMAHLLGVDKQALSNDAQATALQAAARWQCTVAFKGPTTWIATPDGRSWRNTRGNVGLATSGSGDVLAGLIAGLLARGASAEQALAWGVALHARAGERLAQRVGPLGYLARELSAEVPALMHELSSAG